MAEEITIVVDDTTEVVTLNVVTALQATDIDTLAKLNTVVTDATIIDDNSAAVALNTAKTGITAQQATDITTNNAKVTNATHTGDVTGDTALTIGAKKVTLAMMEDGVDGELITYDANGVAAKVAVGTATHVLTSNGVGAAPTFQAAAGGGGGGFQYYEFKGRVANPNISTWCMRDGIDSFIQFQETTGVSVTNSFATISAGNLAQSRPFGLAVGNQTVVSFDILASYLSNTYLTNISIIKATQTGQASYSSIVELYSGAVSIPNSGGGGAKLSIPASSFTVTSIDDLDLIFVAVGTNTLITFDPVIFSLKCSID